jgi:hypothetical protein
VRRHAGHKLRDPAPRLLELRRSPLYAEQLGIDLASGKDEDYFRWFLASLLFGGHISETIARRTYQSFCRHGLISPRRVVAAGWDFLVNPVMREGGYVRYDGRKSDQILRDCETLLTRYGGKLSRLHQAAHNSRDLEARLDAFYGVGPVTANIFLRELRPFWSKADPTPLPSVLALATKLSIALGRRPRKTLSFARLEAGLIRFSHGRRSGRVRTPPSRSAATPRYGHAPASEAEDAVEAEAPFRR